MLFKLNMELAISTRRPMQLRDLSSTSTPLRKRIHSRPTATTRIKRSTFQNTMPPTQSAPRTLTQAAAGCKHLMADSRQRHPMLRELRLWRR